MNNRQSINRSAVLSARGVAFDRDPAKPFLEAKSSLLDSSNFNQSYATTSRSGLMLRGGLGSTYASGNNSSNSKTMQTFGRESNPLSRRYLSDVKTSLGLRGSYQRDPKASMEEEK